MFKEQSHTLEQIEKFSSAFNLLLNAEKLEGENPNLMNKKVGYKVARQVAVLEGVMKAYGKRKQEVVEDVNKKFEKKKFSSDQEKNIQKAKALTEGLEELSTAKETVKIISEPLKQSELDDFDFPSAVYLYAGDLIDEVK